MRTNGYKIAFLVIAILFAAIIALAMDRTRTTYFESSVLKAEKEGLEFSLRLSGQFTQVRDNLLLDERKFGSPFRARISIFSEIDKHQYKSAILVSFTITKKGRTLLTQNHFSSKTDHFGEPVNGVSVAGFSAPIFEMQEKPVEVEINIDLCGNGDCNLYNFGGSLSFSVRTEYSWGLFDRLSSV